jgi:hypothetical protein
MFKIFLSCKSRDYGSGNKIINALRKSTLQFCGINPVKVSTLYVKKDASKLEVENKIRLIYQAGLDRK